MTPAMGCLARAGYSAPVRLSCERNRYLLSRKRDSLLRVCAGKPFSINVLGAPARPWHGRCKRLAGPMGRLVREGRSSQ